MDGRESVIAHKKKQLLFRIETLKEKRREGKLSNCRLHDRSPWREAVEGEIQSPLWPLPLPLSPHSIRSFPEEGRKEKRFIDSDGNSPAFS